MNPFVAARVAGTGVAFAAGSRVRDYDAPVGSPLSNPAHTRPWVRLPSGKAVV